MNDATRVTVSFFESVAGDRKRQQEISLPELVELIRETSAPAKDELPWLKLARFGNARTSKGSYRHDRNVIAITGIEADYDAEQIGFDEAVEIAEKAGLLALIYTSPSHTEARPRWRVLCPTSREYPPATRREFLGRLNGLYRGVINRSTVTVIPTDRGAEQVSGAR